jgi:hypothetical protein
VRDAILRRFLPGERTRTLANWGTKLALSGYFFFPSFLGLVLLLSLSLFLRAIVE